MGRNSTGRGGVRKRLNKASDRMRELTKSVGRIAAEDTRRSNPSVSGSSPQSENGPETQSGDGLKSRVEECIASGRKIWAGLQGVRDELMASDFRLHRGESCDQNQQEIDDLFGALKEEVRCFVETHGKLVDDVLPTIEARFGSLAQADELREEIDIARFIERTHSAADLSEI